MGYRRRTYRNPKRERRPIPREVRQQVFTEANETCALCGSRYDLEVDHIIPHARGGSDSVDNLQILCGECNRGKIDRVSNHYDFR